MPDRSLSLRSPIGIIGSGKLATALIPYLQSHHLNVAGLWSRNQERGRIIAKKAGIQRLRDLPEVVNVSRVLILAVSDGAIATVAKALARTSLQGFLVIHASGCLALDTLGSCREAGAATAVIHPLMTLTMEKGKANPFQGAPLGVVCSDRRLERTLRQMCSGAGHAVFRMPPGSRPLYHSAAVLACAGLHELFMAAARLLEHEGIATGKKARDILFPIARQTLDLVHRSEGRTTTGPWSRADSRVVDMHLSALKNGHQSVSCLYESLRNLSLKGKSDV